MKGWYELNNSNVVFVFIHGFLSDSEKCWTSKKGVFWPKLILNDKRFFRPSIYLADFFTATTSNDYGISECAKEVHAQLLRQDENGNLPPISKENIVFVTHSTGGILARYILEANQATFKNKKVGLCLFASPSYGSKVPLLGQILSRITNNQLARELNWSSDILKDLDDRFIALLGKDNIDIKGIEAYENKAPFSIPFSNYRVVNKESAARYFHKRKLIPKTDHSSIVKPNTTSCASHEFLLDFIIDSNFFPKNRDIDSMSSCVLFNRYEPKYKDYMVLRNQDIKLKQIISQYSVWICGESGTGKTTSIFRALYESNIDFKYISLGAYIGSSVHQLLDAILLELIGDDNYEETKNIAECIKKISTFIINETKQKNYFLFVEEIPISDNTMFVDFSNYIFTLINLLSHIEFKIALSSIYRPNTLSAELKKTSEVLKIEEWLPWEYCEIENLVNLIRLHTGIELTEHSIDTFNGIPRTVKNHFKDELSKQLMQV
jgi:hypothetical protein